MAHHYQREGPMNHLPPAVGTSQTTDGSDQIGLDQAAIYRAIARQTLEAAEILAANAPHLARPIAILCGHGLEVAFKSVLVGSSTTQNLRRIGHNRHAARDAASELLPELSDTFTDPNPVEAENLLRADFEVLHSLHANPSAGRYQEGFPGAVFPAPQRLAQEARRVLDLIEAAPRTP